MNHSVLISVVAPVYNEAPLLEEFTKRTTAALSEWPFELIFVNDGSQDASWSVLQALGQKDARVKSICFSRNFGHQAAICAGLEHAKGNAVIIIDADLQDPPELMPEMLRKWQEGFDVVYGVRSERKGESAFKKWTATAFYRLFRRMSNMNAPLEAGDYRLLSRPVVDVLKQMPERVRFLRGLVSWVGFRQTGITYSREKRFAGTSKYPLFRMLRFALDGFTSFSSAPLQLAIYLGLFVTLIAFLIGCYSLYIRLFTDTAVKGWTSLLTVMVFLGGIQLIMFGVIGEYIGRIYEEVKRRPLYLVQDKIGFEERVLEGERKKP